MNGNKMNVDPQGFAHVDAIENELEIGSTHIRTRMPANLETGHIMKSAIELQGNSNCWICEGWTQVEFKLDLKRVDNPELDLNDDDPVFIHFSFEDYQPDILVKKQEGSVYSVTRMIPPVGIDYFFSIKGKAKHAKNLDIHKAPYVYKGDEKVPITVLGQKMFMPPKTNIIKNVIQTSEVVTETYLEHLQCKPRDARDFSKFVKIEIEAEPEWDWSKSIFKNYKIDTESTLKKCFEYDWARLKLPKVIKNPDELAAVKPILQQHYKRIRETYKSYAGVNPCNNVPSIGSNALSDIVQKAGILQDGKINSSAIDIEFTATNQSNEKNKLNPERQLVRYQLMEILARAGNYKYFKSKECANPAEAIEKFLT